MPCYSGGIAAGHLLHALMAYRHGGTCAHLRPMEFNMSQATATATAAAAAAAAQQAPAAKRVPVARLVMGDKQALDILFPMKGHAEKVERFFDAVAPMLSTWLATGGNKTDFQAASKERHGALVSALWAAHATGKGTAKKIGNAWAAVAARALTVPGKSCSHDQGAHDEAVTDMAAEFMAFFPAPAVREKAADYESPADKVKRLEAECAALRIECDALKAAAEKAPAAWAAAMLKKAAAAAPAMDPLPILDVDMAA